MLFLLTWLEHITGRVKEAHMKKYDWMVLEVNMKWVQVIGAADGGDSYKEYSVCLIFREL